MAANHQHVRAPLPHGGEDLLHRVTAADLELASDRGPHPRAQPDAARIRDVGSRVSRPLRVPRLDQERRLDEGMAADLTDDHREILWALAELLDALRLQLDHLIGLCHQAPQFAQVTGKILATLGHWCRALEEALGPRAIAVMPRPSREVLALIDPEFAAVEA
jgi:hypothetical protein